VGTTSFGRRRGVVAAVAASLSLSLAACGGSEAPVEDGGGGDGDLGTIRVVLSEGKSVPFIAADAGNLLGAWDDKGIDVEIIAASSTTAAATLAAGEADISLQAGNQVVGAILSGLDACLAAAGVLPWDQFMIASNTTGATEPEDLEKGTTFGISGFGSAGHFATLKAVNSLGWSEGDYEIVQMGSLDNLLAGLETNTIDVFIWSLEPALTAEQEGFGTILGSVAPLVGPAVFEAFAVRNDVAEERPEAVKAFFEGYYEAVEELQADPEKATDIIQNEWGNTQLVAERSTEEIIPLLSTDGDIPEENLQGLAEAVTLTVEDAGDFDIESMYCPWTELG
jgi:ABC-type nitrate/sulfonate/bicarbonate transport system substrate-binding protein